MTSKIDSLLPYMKDISKMFQQSSVWVTTQSHGTECRLLVRKLKKIQKTLFSLEQLVHDCVACDRMIMIA